TLRTAIDWSWSLLEDWEQAALRQCSVFRGGFTVDAAEAVVDLARFPRAPPVIDAIQSLRDKSLLYLAPSVDFPREVRLDLYESIRAYAAEKLLSGLFEPSKLSERSHDGAASGPDELDEVLRRHSAHFLDAAAWTQRTNDIGTADDLRRLTLDR